MLKTARLIICCSVLIFLLSVGFRLFIIHNLNLNWDEFTFLNKIYLYSRGELSQGLQTFHVHLFTWLMSFGDEVSVLLMARQSTLLISALGSLAFAAWVWRSHDWPTAAWSLLFTSCFSATLIYSFSFRADPYCVALMMFALLFLSFRQLSPSAFLAALATLISIKSVIFLPALGTQIFLREDRKCRNRRFLQFLATYSVSLFLLFLWHKGTLASETASVLKTLQVSSEQDLFTSAFSKVFLELKILKNGVFYARNIRENLVPWILVLGGLLFLLYHRKRPPILATVLMLPLLFALFYRNIYPYFFVFFAPGLSLGAALSIKSLDFRWRSILLFVLLLQGGIEATLRSGDSLSHQRGILRELHKAFPEPVPYFDRANILPTFDNQSLFMSSWVLSNYAKLKNHHFLRAFEVHKPRFLVANHHCLVPGISSKRCPQLSDKDLDILKRHYLPFWGKIFLLGNREDLQAGEVKEVSVPIPETYKLISSGEWIIDGQKYNEGDTLSLDSHFIRVQNPDGAMRHFAFRLSVGDPNMPPYPEQSFFSGFTGSHFEQYYTILIKLFSKILPLQEAKL